ncbi:MAG: PTS sugar transporter subunit IIC [Aerococcus sp.]|nr:PTS sugar transporter subunit IIC [Aerococcus sp.]
MFERLNKLFQPLAVAIGRNKYLMSIRDGFLVATPLLITGSIFLLIANFPIPAVTEFFNSVIINPETQATLADYLAVPADATYTIMAVFAVAGIAYAFSKRMAVKPIFGAVTALMSWFILMPFQLTQTPLGAVEDAPAVTVTGIDLGWMGAKGIFIGIICAFLSVHIYAWVNKKGWKIRMPEEVPENVVETFSSLIPILFVMCFFFLVNLLFGLAGTNAFEFIYKFLQIPLLNLGDTLGSMIIAYIFLHFFWFFGINGGSVVGAVFNPILQTLSLENVKFFQTGVGQAHIINQQFQDLFATFGGAGSTLSLAIAMIVVCRSKRMKELGKLALVPGIFNINEPIIFGMPIVLNPIMIVPFMLAPTVNIIISYFVMRIGLVPITSGINIPWPTPAIISGFLATNWAGALLQAGLLVIDFFIYLPFLKVLDNQYVAEEKGSVEPAKVAE